MSNERKDEFLSWRSRLDQPEGVPGQGLDDPEATWQRLMDRIREKPRRRLSAYAVVAACFVLALIPAARLFQNHPTRMIARPGNAQRMTPLPARSDEGQHSYISSSPAPASSATGQRLPDRQKPSQTGGRKIKPAAGWQKPHAGGPLNMADVAAAGDTAHPPETLTATLPAPLPLAQQPPAMQKKWKVVDLNELNSGWRPPHGMVTNRRFGSFRIVLGKPGPGAEDDPSPATAPGIKINLSTSN